MKKSKIFTKHNNFYSFDIFHKKYNVLNTFSSISAGNIGIKNKDASRFDVFCKNLNINKSNCIWMSQVHGNKVVFVSKKNKEKIIKDTDGMITSDKGVFLIGTFADCVPLMFFDKKSNVFGIAHAGWKGTYKEIAREMVSKIIGKGIEAENIVVGVGPSIRSCCYEIYGKRKEVFVKKFDKWRNKIIKKAKNKTFLDLQNLIKLQLIDIGIKDENIYDSQVCTADKGSGFYSFRSQNTKDFNRFIGLIGKA
jgi:polyphenol oxidase